MSIKNQATFWLHSVCELPDESYFKERNISDYLVEGFKEFGSLLKNIYKEYYLFEVSDLESIKTKIGIMSDDLDNYHNLTDTMACLYYLGFVGEIDFEGEISFLRVNKALFKSSFKKTVTYFFNVLENYSFYLKYYKKGEEVRQYKQCDTFELYYDNKNSLMEAMKYLTKHLPVTTVKDDYCIPKTLFMLADYDSIILNKSTKRKDINPLHSSILNTAGVRNEMWSEIVEILTNQNDLKTDVSINTYVFPNWTVKFLHKKKTICTFSISTDNIGIRFPLSYTQAKDLIKSREKLPKSINDCFNNFGCVKCGKCHDQSNIEIFEGITLCKLNYINFVTEDSRCIQLSLCSKEEVKVMCDIILHSIKERG